MTLYDVSMEITEDMQVYKMKDIKRPVFEIRDTYENSHHYESSIHLDSHTGTHIDAPLHMLEDGRNLSYLTLEDLIRPAKVLDLTNCDDKLTDEFFKNKNIEEGDFLLFKTKNSFSSAIHTDYVGLHSTGAQYLVDKKVKGVGIDALSIGRGEDNPICHRTLMEKEIIIIEGLYLKDVEEDTYEMIALPLKINVLEGTPMRVVLKK